jgi:hypothetical protein
MKRIWEPDDRQKAKARNLVEWIHWLTRDGGKIASSINNNDVWLDLDWRQLSQAVDEIYDIMELPKLIRMNQQRVTRDRGKADAKKKQDKDTARIRQ